MTPLNDTRRSFRILVLCPHFAPDLHAATGEVMTRLVEALAARGHTIDVVTSLPWYRDHDVESEWRGRPIRRQRTSFGSITRVWPFPTDKGNIVPRTLAFIGETLLSLLVSVVKNRPDVILAMSPPIFFGGAARILAARFRAPFVFNVQDIFPDVAVDLGMLTNTKVISMAQWFERSLYASADAVTVLSQDQADNVRDKLGEGIDPLDRVRIIPNFVDTDRVKVVEGHTRYRRRHDLDDKLVVMYSGNVGFSQSFDLIERAAQHFVEADPRVMFVINGEGAARPLVEDWAADLPNVLVTDFAPRHEVSDVLGSADLQLILLAPGLARSSTPSKLYGIMAAGRPVLASIDLGSDADLIIRDAGAGVVVPPGEPVAFIDALESLLGEPEELERMGRRAHAYVTHLVTPDQQAKAYELLFSQLTNR